MPPSEPDSVVSWRLACDHRKNSSGAGGGCRPLGFVCFHTIRAQFSNLVREAR